MLAASEAFSDFRATPSARAGYSGQNDLGELRNKKCEPTVGPGAGVNGVGVAEDGECGGRF